MSLHMKERLELCLTSAREIFKAKFTRCYILMAAQCNSLFDVEIISVIPGSWQGDGSRTSITVDFGDGHAITYSNVSSIEDGIKHIYKTVGIYRVTATAENSLGFETTVLFLHVTCELLTMQRFSPDT